MSLHGIVQNIEMGEMGDIALTKTRTIGKKNQPKMKDFSKSQISTFVYLPHQYTGWAKKQEHP